MLPAAAWARQTEAAVWVPCLLAIYGVGISGACSQPGRNTTYFKSLKIEESKVAPCCAYFKAMVPIQEGPQRADF